jgi:hypothetical protein
LGKLTDLIYDQAELFQRATELVTISFDDSSDYELISVEKRKTPEQIRKAFLRSNIEPLEKSMEKGPDYVRKFYNAKNLRKRKEIENLHHGQKL